MPISQSWLVKHLQKRADVVSSLEVAVTTQQEHISASDHNVRLENEADTSARQQADMGCYSQ